MRILFLIISIVLITACRPTKKVISSVIGPKDSTAIVAAKTAEEAARLVNAAKERIKANYIDYRTFSAKIKIDSENSDGKNPDVTAVVRMMKDSAIWVSLTATLVNFEVYRIFITKDKVILLDKSAKTYQERSLDYLQEVTNIPFDFTTLQDLIIGNPVFYDTTNISVKMLEAFVLVNCKTSDFKNQMTLSSVDFLLRAIKLDDINMERNRSAQISYAEYESIAGVNFSTYREMTITEKNKLDVRLKYKQVEFNKDLQLSFSIPKNYKRK